MSSEPTNPSEYRGIKRIQKACLNCRRKKAKCSGDRPTCSCCLRLSQECRWDNGSVRSQENLDQNMGGQDDTASVYDNNGLPARVGAIEAKLDNLTNMMTTLMPLLASQSSGSPESAASRTSDDLQASHTPSWQSTAGVHINDQSPFKSLPPPEILKSVIDTYFERLHNQPYSFFHEGRFRSRLANKQFPDHLVFSVLAIALRFSTHPYYAGRVDEAITAYAGNAWRQLVLTWFATETDPNITICQSITLLSIVDFTAGKYHPAWLKIGLSVRIAQDLRLMLEPDNTLVAEDQEERRRVFWSIYVLDKFCSCGRARPSNIIDSHCQLQLPGTEEDFRKGLSRQTQTLAQALSPENLRPGAGGLGTIVILASILGHCAQNNLREHVHGENILPPWDSKSDLATISSTLFQLEIPLEIGASIGDLILRNAMNGGEIDMQITGPAIFAHALFHTCQCLLHHPFLLYQHSRAKGAKIPVSFVNRALETAREHALAFAKLVEDVKLFGCPFSFSFMGYCSTVCGSILLLYLHHENPTFQIQAMQGLNIIKEFLISSSKHWWNASNMLTLLENIDSNAPSFRSSIDLAGGGLSPRIDGFEPPVSELFWAALDYTAMSRTFTLVTPTIKSNENSTYWGAGNVGLGTTLENIQEPDGFDGSQYHPSRPYIPPVTGNTSPLASFMTTSSMNFGG